MKQCYSAIYEESLRFGRGFLRNFQKYFGSQILCTVLLGPIVFPISFSDQSETLFEFPYYCISIRVFHGGLEFQEDQLFLQILSRRIQIWSQIVKNLFLDGPTQPLRQRQFTQFPVIFLLYFCSYATKLPLSHIQNFESA